MEQETDGAARVSQSRTRSGASSRRRVARGLLWVLAPSVVVVALATIVSINAFVILWVVLAGVATTIAYWLGRPFYPDARRDKFRAGMLSILSLNFAPGFAALLWVADAFGGIAFDVGSEEAFFGDLLKFAFPTIVGVVLQCLTIIRARGAAREGRLAIILTWTGLAGVLIFFFGPVQLPFYRIGVLWVTPLVTTLFVYAWFRTVRPATAKKTVVQVLKVDPWADLRQPD